VRNGTIYLIRHAIAEERGDDWPDDSRRPITSKGAARMRQVVRGLRTLDVQLDLVLTSPLIRAAQTAELVVAGLKPSPKLAACKELASAGTPPGVAKALDAYADATHVALIGHEPNLGDLAAWLTGARQPFVFKKGGVCRLDFEGPPAAGAGRLAWLATPAMLRALGDT
jgi:phosphohistidine phosphatase